MGPLSPSNGKKYILTCVDRFSRWPEAFPIESITTDSIVEAFYSGWIARYGCPSKLITDRGSQFTSTSFKEMATLFGIKHVNTTAYHPQSNGMVERMHRTLKTGLACKNNASWTKTLPSVLLGMRASFKEDLKATPAEYLYGENIKLPGDFLKRSYFSSPQTDFILKLKKTIENLRPVPASNHASIKPFIFKDLSTCAHVWIRNNSVQKPLSPKYSGPYEVLARQPKYFTVRIKNKEDNVSIDRIKPAYTDVN